MAREVNFDIVAKDKASDQLDDVADKAAKVEKLKPTVTVDADTKSAASDVDTFAKKLGKLSDEDQVVVLSLRAGAAQSELTDLLSDLATIDASDPTVDIKLDRVAELSEELGDIKQKMLDIDATSLDPGGAQGAPNLSAIGQSAGDVRDRMRETEKSSDAARGAMANFAGNALTTMPGVSGALGPVNQALGEMTEKIAEGDLKFGAIAEQAGPMAGIGVALYAINGYMESIAESDAFHADQVDGFTQAIRDGDDAAKALAERLEKVGKVSATLTEGNAASRAFGLTDTVTDFTSQLTQAGLTIEQYSQLVTGSKQDVADWAAAMLAAGADAGLVNDVIQVIGQGQKDYATATENARVATKFFGDTTKDTAAAVDDHTSSLDRATRATGHTRAETTKMTDALNAARDATDDLDHAYDQLSGNIDRDQSMIDLQNRIAGVQTAAQNAWDAQIAANDALATGAADAKQKQADADQAARDYKTSINDAKDAIIDLGKTAGATPVDVDSELKKIDAGDLNSVAGDAEAWFARNPIDAATRLKLISTVVAGLGPVSTSQGGRSSEAPVINVTQVLPRGYHGDALGDATRAARRSGGLYRRFRR